MRYKPTFSVSVPHVTVLVQSENNNSHNKCKCKSPKKTRLFKSVVHSEFIRLLFLQSHRETDRFFAASGVQLPQTNCGLYHYRRPTFSSFLTLGLEIFSPRLQLYVLILTYMGSLSHLNLTLTLHTHKVLVC